MNPEIDAIIARKRALLALARAKVKQLEEQIAVFATMDETDEFDALLEGRIKRGAPEDPAKSSAPPAAATKSLPPLSIRRSRATTATGRNPKGSIRSSLLEILSDKQERDLDYLEIALNARVAKPVVRGALRATMMNLKNDGTVTSRRPGAFQLA